jgi:hypothetical protein
MADAMTRDQRQRFGLWSLPPTLTADHDGCTMAA